MFQQFRQTHQYIFHEVSKIPVSIGFETKLRRDLSSDETFQSVVNREITLIP